MVYQGEIPILKMKEQGGRVNCYTEYREGILLIDIILKGETISKSQLWKWLQDIGVQIESYHRCYHRAYLYLNPYTIFITSSNKIRLLDLESQENEAMFIYLQKTILRESFHKNSNIKQTKIYTDFYSMGKTLQFIVSQGNICPSINWREYYQLSKVVKKCIEESSQNQNLSIKEIQKQISKLK